MYPHNYMRYLVDKSREDVQMHEKVPQTSNQNKQTAEVERKKKEKAPRETPQGAAQEPEIVGLV